MNRRSLKRALLAVIILDIPFHCDFHLGYRSRLADLNALGGLCISATTFCLAALYGLWLIEAALHIRTDDRQRPSVSRWLVLYLAAVCASGLVASHQTLAAYEILMLMQTFLLYFYIVKRLRTREDVYFVTTLLIASMLLHSVVMIGLRGIGHSITIGPFAGFVDPGMRVGGTIGSPNAAASMVSLLLAPSLGVLVAGTRGWRRGLALAAFVAGGVALVLTLSRGGWLAAGVSVFLFCVIAWSRGWLSSWVLLGVAASVVLAIAPFTEAVAARLSDTEASTVEGRLTLMELAYHMATDNPVLGVGANNFAVSMDPYMPDLALPGSWLHTVHNKYMLVWAENGPIGLVAFVCFLIATVRLGWRTWKCGDRLLAPLGLGFGLGVLGQMLHMNVDLFHSRVQVQLLWLVAGILAVLHALASCGADHRSSSELGMQPRSSTTVWPGQFETQPK